MRVNLIPMAGDGSRFLKGGYKTPKPLIDVDGLPIETTEGSLSSGTMSICLFFGFFFVGSDCGNFEL